MEKKAPERKVRLREGDVFYVYERELISVLRKAVRG